MKEMNEPVYGMSFSERVFSEVRVACEGEEAARVELQEPHRLGKNVRHNGMLFSC